MRFGCVNPRVALLYFAGAVLISIVADAAIFQAICVVCSALLSAVLMRRRAGAVLLGMALLFAVVTVVNPIFSAQGQTVLFYAVGGRPYTLEALCAGASMAAVFVSALLWLMCFSQVLDFEAQLYLIRSVSGAVSLVLSMCARMIERFKAKIASMQDGRRGLGMCVQGGFTARLSHAADIVGALSGWVFEDAMVAADSMMARGFAAKKCTSIRCYVMRAKDWYLLVATILGVVAYFACTAVGWGQWSGALGAASLQQVVFGWVMLVLCLIYMLSFSVVVAGEELQWRLYLLKM